MFRAHYLYILFNRLLFQARFLIYLHNNAARELLSPPYRGVNGGTVVKEVIGGRI